MHFASAGLRMSYDASNAPPLHAPWYVEGSFDVNVYYHGWPDDTEPPTPTQLDSDSDGDQSMASTQCSIRTVEYVAGAHGDDPPRLRLSYFLGVTDLQLIEPEPSHVAERMAMCFLRFAKWECLYDDQLHALWELLPHDQPREHQTFMCDNGSAAQAFSFTTGAFQAGGLVGVRNNTFQLPWVTALLCQIAHSVFRGMAGSTGERAFHFSSLSLLRNVHSSVHRDGNNHSGCNTRLIPLSRFSGGELWCHDPVAGEVLYPGTALYGTLHALAPPCLEFNASELHGTFPWIGDRVVLAAYHMKTPSSLNAGEAQFLRHVGFRLLTE